MSEGQSANLGIFCWPSWDVLKSRVVTLLEARVCRVCRRCMWCLSCGAVGESMFIRGGRPRRFSVPCHMWRSLGAVCSRFLLAKSSQGFSGSANILWTVGTYHGRSPRSPIESAFGLLSTFCELWTVVDNPEQDPYCSSSCEDSKIEMGRLNFFLLRLTTDHLLQYTICR